MLINALTKKRVVVKKKKKKKEVVKEKTKVINPDLLDYMGSRWR